MHSWQGLARVVSGWAPCFFGANHEHRGFGWIGLASGIRSGIRLGVCVDLQGKASLITGGTSGIGAHCTKTHTGRLPGENFVMDVGMTMRVA